jgi:hypothetical protein
MIYYAINTRTRTVSTVSVSCFEQLQAMFRFGISLPDGQRANAIGRMKPEEFNKRVKNYTLLTYDNATT